MLQSAHFREIPRPLLERATTGNITPADGVYLFTECEPLELFALADRLRRITSGERVTYVLNRNINFTNRCIGSCRFCAFRDDDGYLFSIDEIMEKVREAVRIGVSEICIQGGLLEDARLEEYCRILHSIKSEFPHLHLHAYSPMEVSHMAANSGVTIKRALLRLRECGLGSMPGTAAEILSERVREEICPEKLSAREWIEVVETAHMAGIPTTATMMYGHVETVEERIEHLILIRELQRRTGGFTEFVPLPFLPRNNELGERLLRERGFERVNGTDDLKVHAIARIILHTHINNIQASWVKLGVKLAQIALHCGASDLGGTLMEERISKSAGATSGEYLAPSKLNTIIREAGREPAIRDTLYRRITPQFE